MKKCWAESPEDRPTFRDIYNELWEFYKPVEEEEETAEEIPLESLNNIAQYGENVISNYGKHATKKNDSEIMYNSN